MSSFERFSYSVSKVDDLTPPVRLALLAQLVPGEAICQIIFAPRQDRPFGRRGVGDWLGARYTGRQTPSWVLVLTEDRLLVATLADATSPPEVSSTPLSDLLWLELGTILLYSWTSWSCAGGTGRPRHERVYFNTVGDRLFWDLVNAIRGMIITQIGLPRSADERRSEVFDGLPFKYQNLVPGRLLLPDEEVQAIVYQPAIWRQRWRFFSHQRAPVTVVVLSPDYLLVAQDDLTNIKAAYGIISRYVPRSRLRRVTLEHIRDDLWLNVTVGLRETEESFRYLFEVGSGPALQALIALV